MTLEVLLVGAGAVGQVYGRHLQLGGARTSFYVRPKAAEAIRDGMTMYPLRKKDEREPVVYRADAVYTDLAKVAERRWDQVWLCLPTTALDPAWLAEIAAAVGRATVVALPPGMDSFERIQTAFAGRPVVSALIGMISYQAPLPGETVPRPGMAYLFPPGRPSAFGGPEASAVVQALRAGGCPAKEDPNAGAASAFGSGLLMPNIAALETAGWSIAKLRRGDHLDLAAAASREAMAVAAARMGVDPPMVRELIRGPILKLAWAAVPHLLPIDVETYVAYHFTKVGEQTRELLEEYRREGEARGLPTEAIVKLAAALPPLPEG